MKEFYYRLCKLPAEEDPWDRNIKFARILKALPAIPKEYNGLAGIDFPTPVFGNDTWSNCVTVAKAHHTRWFELYEQGKLIDITDAEVLNQYWDEGSLGCKLLRRIKKPDNGLILLESLKSWRKNGWIAGGQKLDIWAFDQANQLDKEEMQAVLYLLGGANIGVLLPNTAKQQFENGEPWDPYGSGWDSTPGSWGGHGIWLPPVYDYDTTLCVTWGKFQVVTWDFLFKYCDEYYGVADNRDRFLENSPVDVEKFDSYLKEITRRRQYDTRR